MKENYELALKVSQRLMKQEEELKKSYSEDMRELLRLTGGYSSKVQDTIIGKQLMEFLENATHKPSDFFRKHISMMPGWIGDHLLENFYISVDSVTKWQISKSYYRRSMRSSKYTSYINKIFDIVNAYHRASVFNMDIIDIYENRLPVEMQAYRHHFSWKSDIPDVWIAAELDKGNQALENILTDIICGDANQNKVSYQMIRGIIMSQNQKMHELLGKLLLAARLQEGLRQSICENMDCGCVEAFSYLFHIIVEENLIRYSSVMRAAGTWTGLLAEEDKDIDRISKKQIGLIETFLTDEVKREKALHSEDAMELYLALWSYGFRDVYVAREKILELMKTGTRHQKMVGCFYLRTIELSDVEHRMAKYIIKQYSDDLEMMAVVMPSFMPGNYNYIRQIVDDKKKRYADVEFYFTSREECEEYYGVLMQMLQAMPKKSISFAPCLFPWNEEVLSKSALVKRLCICASALRNDTKIEDVAELLPLINASDSYSRESNLELLLRQPNTKRQKSILTAAIADSETGTRESAFKLITDVQLDTENYQQLEEMLKYKKADVRNNVLKLLYALDGVEMKALIQRLLQDKKEEKRTAGLDLLLQLKKDKERQALFAECKPLVDEIKGEISSKEDILIKEITEVKQSIVGIEQGYGLYAPDADYEPVFDKQYLESCIKIYKEYFPESCFGGKAKNITNLFLGKSGNAGRFMELLSKLDIMIDERKNEEYTGWNGEIYLFGNNLVSCRDEAGKTTIPLLKVWEEFYQNEIGSYKELLRMVVWLDGAGMPDITGFFKYYAELMDELIGKEFNVNVEFKYPKHIATIVYHLEKRYRDRGVLQQLSVVVADYLLHTKTSLLYEYEQKASAWENQKGKVKKVRSVMTHHRMKRLLAELSEVKDMELFRLVFPYHYALAAKLEFNFVRDEYGFSYSIYYSDNVARTLSLPGLTHYVIANSLGMLSKDFMYKAAINYRKFTDTISDLSYLIQYQRERNRQLATRKKEGMWVDKRRKELVERLLCHALEEEITAEDEQRLQIAEAMYEDISSLLMEAELKRGDSETIFSKYIFSLKRVYGVEYFVRILTALGRETLERSTWFDSGYYMGRDVQVSKKQSLCHLLMVCMPNDEDDVARLAALLKETDVSEMRLIEAGLYAPEWLEIVDGYLGWKGFVSCCYYFMAHMNEKFDDKRTAMITKYTPISIEDLNNGAFDLKWFREVYEEIGEKRFLSIYKAAKYISDGAKHTRARKYADAAIGKTEASVARREIEQKRNKDLLMAYGLIPLQGEADLVQRYMYLQQFLKESKQFGAQRRASESLAVDNAMKNLALNAGYPDETRLILKMESKIAQGMASLFEPVVIEEVSVRLVLDENGKGDILCEKAGKQLKSIPAKLKKNEYIKTLTESKKQLTQQYRRTKAMLEEAMEEETEFEFGEFVDMLANPVAALLVKHLVLLSGERLGFLKEDGLLDYNGEKAACKKTDKVVIAHPFHLFKAGCWRAYQKVLFDQQIKQPFKQVFRELYVKTPEELEQYHSLRYAGNQIQPKKTLGCLKTRRWVADVDSGIQKVYYKENIVAGIYALADWFSPADIESPTLEWVVFTDRKTFKDIPIKEIPDILFSEVMRDVDMAVSVAHAGGVDPETSHSTMEMRKAIAEFTIPLFKLNNVTFTDHHAIIKGARAEYTLHLGSGVIHQAGGPMIQVLPVHSQHRGRIFLPFVDEDPKTAEVLSKILLFAEDNKIKDPFILEQIQ